MGKNLYDVLELSRVAGAEAIQAAYERLFAKYSPDNLANTDKSEAQIALKAVSEAHRILSNPDRKSRYDSFLESLEPPPVILAPEAFWTPLKLTFLAVFFVLSSLLYYNYHLAQLEKARQIAALQREKSDAEAEAERIRLEQERVQQERQELAFQYNQEQIQRARSEQLSREARQIIQQTSAAEQRAKEESQRIAQQAARAAERQIALERQKFESQRRQEEYQRQAEQARQERLAEQQRYLNARQGYQNNLTPNDIKLRSIQAN